MISRSFSIGVSGLNANQTIMDMLSHNVANIETPGYKRLENTNREINFSGPDNKPFMPAGVDVSVAANDYPWLDRRYADALYDKSLNDAVKDGMDDLSAVVSNNTLSEAFTNFMNASHSAMQFPDDEVHAENFEQTGQAFVDAMNRVDVQIAGSIQTMREKIDLNQIELDAIKSQMQDLTTKSNTPDVVNDLNYLKQQLSQISGSIAGYNKVLSSLVPPITGMYNQAKQTVINGTNTSFGAEIISTGADLPQYKWNRGSSGDMTSLVEFGNQQFNKDIGRMKTIMGAAQSSANAGSIFGENALNAAGQAYGDAYGVDLDDQVVKMLQAQRLYEANTKVIQTADSMLGSLLNIFQ